MVAVQVHGMFPDVLLLDQPLVSHTLLSGVVLPNSTSGPELIQILEQCCPSAKTFLMPGYAGSEVIEPNGGASAYPVLIKPFTKEKLAWKVYEALNSVLEEA